MNENLPLEALNGNVLTNSLSALIVYMLWKIQNGIDALRKLMEKKVRR